MTVMGKDMRDKLKELGFDIPHVHDRYTIAAVPPTGWGHETPEGKAAPEPRQYADTSAHLVWDDKNEPRIWLYEYSGDMEDLSDPDTSWLEFL
jgi:hypothetical protein